MAGTGRRKGREELLPYNLSCQPQIQWNVTLGGDKTKGEHLGPAGAWPRITSSKRCRIVLSLPCPANYLLPASINVFLVGKSLCGVPPWHYSAGIQVAQPGVSRGTIAHQAGERSFLCSPHWGEPPVLRICRELWGAQPCLAFWSQQGGILVAAGMGNKWRAEHHCPGM